MHRQTEKQFSLKDELFNRQKVRRLAEEIKLAHPAFDARGFEQKVVEKFPEQELMERVRGIRDQLRAHLPKPYREAIKIIIRALPSPLDEDKSDNDFGDFIYAPYTYFVATYGCTEKHVSLSLDALKEMTKRFSAEGALRDFLNAFPKETLAAVEQWSKDPNYHVRRLASEGTRPNLPWAKKVQIAPAKLAPILDRLHADPTRYVVRSVANHMNDLTKVDKQLALKLLGQWRKRKQQSDKELSYLTSHALRTLIRAGDTDALKLVGYDSEHIKVTGFKLVSPKVWIGDSLEFSFKLLSTADHEQDVLIDYIIHFNKANGKLAPKTFKIAKKKLQPKEKLPVAKTHSFKLMSTRTLYPGRHAVELQINGRSMGKEQFDLLPPKS